MTRGYGDQPRTAHPISTRGDMVMLPHYNTVWIRNYPLIHQITQINLTLLSLFQTLSDTFFMPLFDCEANFCAESHDEKPTRSPEGVSRPCRTQSRCGSKRSCWGPSVDMSGDNGWTSKGSVVLQRAEEPLYVGHGSLKVLYLFNTPGLTAVVSFCVSSPGHMISSHGLPQPCVTWLATQKWTMLSGLKSDFG